MKRISLIAVLAALAAASTAQARRPALSVARAKAAMVANAQLDRPASVSVTGCRRLSRVKIVCTVSEIAAHTLILDNDQPIVGDTSGETEAVLARGRVLVS